MPDHALLRLRSALTLEAWARPTAASSVQHITGKLNYELTAIAEGSGVRFLFEFSTNWGNWHNLSAGPYPLNAWYHLAGCYDGTTARLFVDGQLVGEQAVSGLVDPTAHHFYIGSAEDYFDYFTGQIDEVRLSKVARYAASFSRPTVHFEPDGETVGLWHLDEGAGSTTADASANSFTGTLVNGPTWSQESPFG